MNFEDLGSAKLTYQLYVPLEYVLRWRSSNAVQHPAKLTMYDSMIYPGLYE